jgi:hypothetical protein
MIKGNITRSCYGIYTVSIFINGKRVVKVNDIYSLPTAQQIIEEEKKKLQEKEKTPVTTDDNQDYKRSYPEFEGKILKWKNKNYRGGKVCTVVVAGFDYDIGISLVNPKDPKDLFSCYHGEFSPDRKISKHISLDLYDKAFREIVKIVENNEMYDVQRVRKAMGRNKDGNGGMSCAFSS